MFLNIVSDVNKGANNILNPGRVLWI